MKQKEILEGLRAYKKRFSKQYGILDIGVFGSVARGDYDNESDVDIVVRLQKQDLFLLAGLKYDLEETFHRSIDIVAYRDTMNPFLKKRIDREAVYV